MDAILCLFENPPSVPASTTIVLILILPQIFATLITFLVTFFQSKKHAVVSKDTNSRVNGALELAKQESFAKGFDCGIAWYKDHIAEESEVKVQ